MLQDISIYCLIWENNRLIWLIYTLLEYCFETGTCVLHLRDLHEQGHMLPGILPSIHLTKKYKGSKDYRMPQVYIINLLISC